MPSSGLVGSSEQTQRDFTQYVLGEWERAGPELEFLSWFPMADWWYDSNLKTSQGPTVCGQPIAVVDEASAGIEKVSSVTGQPFIGIGNTLAPFFGYVGDASMAANASSDFSIQAGRIARGCAFLSSCGLYRADGSAKPAATEFAARAAQMRAR